MDIVFENKKDLVIKNLRMKRPVSNSQISESKGTDVEGTSLLPNVIMDRKLKNSATFNFMGNIVGYASIDFINSSELGSYGFYAFYVYKEYRNMSLNKVFLLKMMQELNVDYVICIVDPKSYYAYNSCKKAGFLDLPKEEYMNYVKVLKENHINILPPKTFLLYIK